MTLFSTDVTQSDVYLPFIPTNVAYEVEEIVLDESDEGTSDAISIPIGFPFGESLQNQFYVMPSNSICIYLICISEL